MVALQPSGFLPTFGAFILFLAIQGQIIPAAHASVPGAQGMILGSSRYLFTGMLVKWQDAKRFCESAQMHLATIETRQEASAIHNASLNGASSLNKLMYWTSGSDLGRRPGDFHWESGEQVDVDLWAKNSPGTLRSGTSNCVVLLSGWLSDLECNRTAPVLCETLAQ